MEKILAVCEGEPGMPEDPLSSPLFQLTGFRLLRGRVAVWRKLLMAPVSHTQGSLCPFLAADCFLSRISASALSPRLLLHLCTSLASVTSSSSPRTTAKALHHSAPAAFFFSAAASCTCSSRHLPPLSSCPTGYYPLLTTTPRSSSHEATTLFTTLSIDFRVNF